MYPSAISKPSYRRRLHCEHCAGRPCEVCGVWIKATSGRQSYTCSEKCRKIRNTRRETERYHRVKDSDEWKSVRAAYVATIKARLAADPEFAKSYRESLRKRSAEYSYRQKSDPSSCEKYFERRRLVAAAKRARVRADPELYARHIAKSRAWYHGLSAEDRERIFYDPKRAKRAAKKAKQA